MASKCYPRGVNYGPIDWVLKGSQCSGREDTYIANDFSSGDSFYLIDFSKCTKPGRSFQLVVGGDKSAPFDITANPYRNLKYEFYDYFRDHETSATFNQAINLWQSDISVTFNYVRDAGDNGAYPVNTAEAAWTFINLLEAYPEVNNYFKDGLPGAKSVYDQLLLMTEQFDGKLAIPKFHTNVNDTWALCAPFTSGTCIAEPETKATLATARTLAAMARLHLKYGSEKLAKSTYERAVAVFNHAKNEPLTCNQASAFGGEGGMYPDNDLYASFRNPEKPRDNCYPSDINTKDDEYAALVALFLGAKKLGLNAEANTYKTLVQSHHHFAKASTFWWHEVAMEGNLSLLTHQKSHSIDLSALIHNTLKKSDQILKNQSLGYPGVTWDPHSKHWFSGDLDQVNQNVRWGSHRMAANDARILMAAAHIKKAQGALDMAADYARGAIRVLDHISGLNPINLAMYTAKSYPFIENAVTRTHDGADEQDLWPGKMVLGPNNWTNANDPYMPAFGSKPGLKMFALRGTGWASREISIDGNASIVPLMYFTSEVAEGFLKASPIQ